MAKKVSLILTTYNCKENLIKTFKSIEEQEEPEIMEKNQNENEEVPKKRTRNQILND